MALTLSVSNIVLTLAVPNLVSQTTLSGFAPDDIYTTEEVDNAETMMGLDGVLSAGYVPMPRIIIFKVMANSQAASFFDQWDAGQQLARDMYPAYGTITFGALKIRAVLTNGFLRAQKFIPDAARILQPRTFRTEWENVQKTGI